MSLASTLGRFAGIARPLPWLVGSRKRSILPTNSSLAVSTAPAPVPMKRTGIDFENFREKKKIAVSTAPAPVGRAFGLKYRLADLLQTISRASSRFTRASRRFTRQ